jgi:hypothetical protein
MAEALNNLSQVLLYNSIADLTDKSPGGTGYQGTTIQELADFFSTGSLDISGKEDVANKNWPNGYCGLDQYMKIPTTAVPVNLGTHSFNSLVVNYSADFKSNVDFEGNVDFEDYVKFYDDVTLQGTGTALFASGGGSEFLTATKFKNAAVRIEGGMDIASGYVNFSNSNGLRLSSPIKDHYGNLPSANGQALTTLGTSGYVTWSDVGASTLRGTYTVVAKTGFATYSPASKKGNFAVTGDIVKCSGYIEANTTMYIQPYLGYTGNTAVRLTSLPYPAAETDHNYGYNTGYNWAGQFTVTDVRGGTLGTWCVTDDLGVIYGSGAVVGVLDENTNFQGATSYETNIYFVGPTTELAITNGKFLKFNFEYIKS